jgi:hypothetical protein
VAATWRATASGPGWPRPQPLGAGGGGHNGRDQGRVSGGDDFTVRVWDLAPGHDVAHWTGDYPVIACTKLSGQPFKGCW